MFYATHQSAVYCVFELLFRSRRRGAEGMVLARGGHRRLTEKKDKWLRLRRRKFRLANHLLLLCAKGAARIFGSVVGGPVT
jgi:hypothetical protein